MIPEEVVIATLAIFALTNNTLNWLIISYIDKKPTGLQTLLDKLTIRLIICNVSSFYCNSIIQYLSVCPIALNPWIAKSIFLLNSFVYCKLLAWFITVICTKYICIFHPILLEDCAYTDSEIARYISIALIAVISTCLGVEVVLISEIKDFTVYQLMMSETIVDENSKKQGLTKISLILYAASFILVSFTQFQIERKGLNQKESQNEKVSKMKWRLGVLFVILSILAIMIIFHKFLLLSDSATKFVNISFMMSLIFILPPLIYISKSNENLKNHAVECIRAVICFGT